jgi:PKD repeat protein
VPVTTPSGGTVQAPVAHFRADAIEGTAPFTVRFTDTSVNSPTSWQYDFGDGSISTAQNPSHTYTAPGLYTVTLRATNSAGSDDEVYVNYIIVRAGTAVQPTTLPTSIPTTTTTPVPTAIPTTAVPVTTPTGGGVQAPVAHFRANAIEGTAPFTVRFTDSSVNSPTSWRYDFGDGSTSTAQNPSHTYAAPGLYTVTLRAINSAGYDDEVYTNYIIVNRNPAVRLPVAHFRANAITGKAPFTVKFTDASVRNPTIWQYTFGDGQMSWSKSPSHTYTRPGLYTVALRAGNAGGWDDEVYVNYIVVR